MSILFLIKENIFIHHHPSYIKRLKCDRPVKSLIGKITKNQDYNVWGLT